LTTKTSENEAERSPEFYHAKLKLICPQNFLFTAYKQTKHTLTCGNNKENSFAESPISAKAVIASKT
jgi:hypothetical protein